jgi:poly-gamma-glutamate synthesis protein (capsule biosynthesis protein)
MKRCIKGFIILSLLLSGCSQGKVNEESNDSQEMTQVEEKEVEKKSITISFAGDMTFGNYVGQGYDGSFNQKYANIQDTSYFLKKVKSVFEKDDLTVANLEGPLTTASSYQIKTFAFKGNPEYRNILVDGSVEAVTIANNHSSDYYEQGLKDTKENLDKVNVGYFGYEDTYVKEIKGIKFGFIGLSFPTEYGTLTKKLISQLKEEADVIILYVHWGIERDEAPSEAQRTLAKQWIDNGVDLVIGSHPHVVQGIENYNGKDIVYSLGNFCFGGNKNPSDKDSMIYQHTFNFEDGKLVDESSQTIACSISSSSSSNNYQPTILSGDEKTRVENKIKARSELLK